jgi:hypothetical protein
MTTFQIETMSDQTLLDEVVRTAATDRATTVRLVALLEAVDARGLYKGLGCASMFVYCTAVLHLAEGAAYLRIGAARASRRFPVILERLATGEINLTTLDLIIPHLTEENHVELLNSARHHTKREVQQLVAAIRPTPDTPSTIRALPAAATAQPLVLIEPASIPPPATIPTCSQPPVVRPNSQKPAVVVPLAPKRFLLKVTLGQETHDTLERLRSLMRHSIPDGDPAKILERALKLLLEQVERTKMASTERPRPRDISEADGRDSDRDSDRERSRHVPAAVKRAVWTRDAGRCAFVGTLGRCQETAFLEFHHVVPFADGGPTTVENLELRCRSHNAYEAALHFEAHDGWLRPVG